MGFFLVFLMIHVLFRKFSFSFWTVLSMVTSDNVIEDALRVSAVIRLDSEAYFFTLEMWRF